METADGIILCYCMNNQFFHGFFSGVGFAMVTVVVLLDIYYNVIMAWGWYYLFASFTTVSIN